MVCGKFHNLLFKASLYRMQGQVNRDAIVELIKDNNDLNNLVTKCSVCLVPKAERSATAQQCDVISILGHFQSNEYRRIGILKNRAVALL